VLSAHGKPIDRLWVPFAGFPNNRRAAEIVVGFVKTYLKEEEEALKARQAAPAADIAEKESLAAQLERYAEFRRGRRQALDLALPSGGPGKPLDDSQRSAILALLEALRTGALPEAVVDRHYHHKRLPAVLNEWIAAAAIEGAEAALADPGGKGELPDAVVEALRYRHAVLRDPNSAKMASTPSTRCWDAAKSSRPRPKRWRPSI
jgi:hypothetical protein